MVKRAQKAAAACAQAGRAAARAFSIQSELESDWDCEYEGINCFNFHSEYVSSGSNWSSSDAESLSENLSSVVKILRSICKNSVSVNTIQRWEHHVHWWIASYLQLPMHSFKSRNLAQKNTNLTSTFQEQ